MDFEKIIKEAIDKIDTMQQDHRHRAKVINETFEEAVKRTGKLNILGSTVPDLFDELLALCKVGGNKLRDQVVTCMLAAEQDVLNAKSIEEANAIKMDCMIRMMMFKANEQRSEINELLKLVTMVVIAMAGMQK